MKRLGQSASWTNANWLQSSTAEGQTDQMFFQPVGDRRDSVLNAESTKIRKCDEMVVAVFLFLQLKWPRGCRLVISPCLVRLFLSAEVLHSDPSDGTLWFSGDLPGVEPVVNHGFSGLCAARRVFLCGIDLSEQVDQIAS